VRQRSRNREPVRDLRRPCRTIPRGRESVCEGQSGYRQRQRGVEEDLRTPTSAVEGTRIGVGAGAVAQSVRKPCSQGELRPTHPQFASHRPGRASDLRARTGVAPTCRGGKPPPDGLQGRAVGTSPEPSNNRAAVRVQGSPADQPLPIVPPTVIPSSTSSSGTPERRLAGRLLSRVASRSDSRESE